MKPKALVVDDDPDIQDAVSDILDSLGHAFDCADSVETARQRLSSNEYTYVLLDLEIPVRAGKNLPRVQNGENLLEEIVRRSGTCRQPIIVMTAHGTEGPELAVEMMKKGASDYVTKPFKSSGRTLDKSIREVLSALGQPWATPSPSGHEEEPSQVATGSTTPLRPFQGGTLIFYQDRVELCGAIICGNGTRSARHRQMLDMLRVRDGAYFARYDCDQLASRIGLATAALASGAVRTLRARIRRALLEQVHITSEPEDVICHDHGYCLSERLNVQDADDDDQRPDYGHHKEPCESDVPDRVPDVPNPHVANVPGDTPSARRAWILERLAAGTELRVADVAKRFSCSKKTAQRDLTTLKEEALIEYVGTARNGHYRHCGGAKTSQ